MWYSRYKKPNSKAKNPLYDVALMRFSESLPLGYEEGDDDNREVKVVVERECKYDEKRKVFTQIDTKEEFELQYIFQWRISPPVNPLNGNERRNPMTQEEYKRAVLNDPKLDNEESFYT